MEYANVFSFRQDSNSDCKLENLNRVDYPKDKLQIIIIDSNSSDNTVEIMTNFVECHPEFNIKVLAETWRDGKAAALNRALDYATGEVIIVSDADCFYQSDVLRKSLPYLADPKVGAISGPKILLNDESSQVVKKEENYLRSMNLAKLGESKIGFTPLFEGGFSAYKRAALSSFDPYKTGSDDCGTVITLAERSYSALLVPEAEFFTTFPVTNRERWGIKIRRSNQLVRVFREYLYLFMRGRIKTAKRVIFANVLVFLFCPFFFLIFLFLTIGTFTFYPYVGLIFLLLLAPKVGPMLIEVVQSYFVLLFSVFSVLFRRDFLIWKQPADRHLFTEKILKQHNLI